MIRTRRARARALVVGFVIAAITAGGTAAATSTIPVELRARLAPVAGTKATGTLDGVLVKARRVGITPGGKTSVPAGGRWRLNWRFVLPKLDGPMTASLKIDSARSSAGVTRVLCSRCSSNAVGTITLTDGQAKRITRGNAVVVVRTRSARLRGRVKVVRHTQAAKQNG